MNSMLKSTPTSVRLALTGLLWGVVCGVIASQLLVLILVSSSVAESGFYWDDLLQSVLGLLVYGAMGCVFGAVIGGVLGLVSGMVAGPVLAVMLRLTQPKAAASSTVVIVVAVQIAVVALLSDYWGWFAFLVPVVGIIPLVVSAFAAARDWPGRSSAPQRDGTFAA